MRRRIAAVAAGLVLSTAAPAWATSDVTAVRFAGDNRYGTAGDIAVKTFTSAAQVLLASGTNFPDALAASYTAGGVRRPILLTHPDFLPAETVSALQTLQTTGVLIVGGPTAVSPAVEDDLKARGLATTRVQGSDRYETARLLAESLPAAGIGRVTVGGTSKPTAVVATGENFPDALAGGPLGYAGKFPILLTPRAQLSAEVTRGFDNLGIRHVLLLGGVEAVSPTVQSEIQARGLTVTRLSGTTRTETAAAVADFEVGTLGFSATAVGLARGDVFADALAGAVRAGESASPVLLASNAGDLGGPAQVWLGGHRDTLQRIYAFGGTSALSNGVVEAALRAAGKQ